MHLQLSSRQTLCSFFLVVLLSTGVFGVILTDSKEGTCCPRTTPGPIQGHIVHCAYVRSKNGCRKAYLLTTKNKKQHCISVDSEWIQSVLEKLKQRGKPCEGTAN